MRLPPSSWTVWSALLLISPTTALNNPLLTRQTNAAFDWTTITPTPDLQYHPCYETFKCARLQVPLDWSTPNTSLSGPHAAIAIVTLPATVPVTDPAYAGPILLNPGGPGGQGTGMALTMAAQLQAIVDVPGERHYDLLGFDPRGVGLTTPSASCYATQFDRAAAGIAARTLPSIVTAQGLQMVFETNRGVGQLCEQTAGKDGIFGQMSTASVARDMLEIVDRNHDLVRKAAGNGTAKACGGEKPGLQYLGLSYGSILGNTFASMFPDRVGRLVVDGIADAEDYFTGVSREISMFESEELTNTYRPGPSKSPTPKTPSTSSTAPASTPATPVCSAR
jgi:pimeloyl-ACP methyl ester carboxylesterase